MPPFPVNRREINVRHLAWAVLVWISSVYAIAAEPFYQAAAPVASQAPADRAQAASAALKVMLWRFTGSRQAEQNTAMASIFSRAETYAESFSYTDDGQVVFTFSPQALNQLVKDYGLPFWPANRPKVLVWFMDNGRWPSTSDLLALKELKAQAALRGIPLVFPKYDEEDRTALSTEQFKAFDSEAILNASFRYSLDTILAVQAEAGAVRWSFDHRGEKRTGENAAAGINQLADLLALRYAVGGAAQPAASSKIYLGVEARNLGAYKHIGDYLKKHGLVTASRLVQSNGGELVFEVSLRASIDQFNSSLTLDQRLEAAANSSGGGSLDAPLNYRWIAN